MKNGIIRQLLVALPLLSLVGWSSACDGVSSTYGTFQGVKKIQIQYIKIETDDQSKGALVMSTGAKAQFLLYCELVLNLKDLGFAIYMIDHRGQGMSDRLLDDPMPHHVDEFSYYVKDLKTLVDDYVKPNHAKVFAWGESMGGGIVTEYAQKYKDDFSAIVLWNPMHQINTSNAGFPEFCAYVITTLGVIFFAGGCYASGQGPYDSAANTFETNDNTSDPTRFASNKEVFERYALGGPTNSWVNEIICATSSMRCNASKLQVPILLLQAELDVVVENSAQNVVCDAAPDCTLVVMAGSKHAIYFERDEIRNVAIYDYTIPFLLDQAGR